MNTQLCALLIWIGKYPFAQKLHPLRYERYPYCRKKYQNIYAINLLMILHLKVIAKACVSYFLSNFYFWPNDSPPKTTKMVFISSKKLFSFSRYSDFCISVFPSFFTASHCFRGWSYINFKTYDAIKCLNKSLGTHFAWKKVGHWNFK